MVIRNLPDGFPGEFICFTDNPEGLHERIKIKSLPEGLKGWWNKLYLFSADAFEYGDRVLYFDLDTVVVNSLDDIAAYNGEFAILRDFYRPDGLQSSVMSWEHKPDVWPIWEEWLAAGNPDVEGGDQIWIEQVFRGRAFKPDIWQEILPNQFVSFKVHATGAIPKGAKVVVFHGEPRPHDIKNGYVPAVWKIGGGASLEMEMTCNASDEMLISNVKHSLKLPHEWLTSSYNDGGEAVIVGGGASIEDYIDELKHRKETGQKIFALNGSAKWLKENGIQPDYHVLLDARPENTSFLESADDSTIYLVASQCHPDAFAKLEDKKVMLWHSMSAAGLIDNNRRYVMVTGGSTVGLCAMILVYIMGFKGMHLFGFDSSYRDAKGHAYNQPQNDNDAIIEVVCGNQRFYSTPWMSDQANNFLKIANRITPAGVAISVYGDGLLPYLVSLSTPERNSAADERAAEILQRLEDIKNPVGAEIGVFAGELSKRLLGSRQDMTLYMVDPWTELDSSSEYAKSDFHGKLNQYEQDEYYRMATGSVSFAGDRAKIIRNFSVNAADKVPDEYLDFCFIDADHTYQAVKEDLAAWYPKVKRGGLICGHDYNHPNFPEWGVKRAVDEFMADKGLLIETGDNYTWFTRLPTN